MDPNTALFLVPHETRFQNRREEYTHRLWLWCYRLAIGLEFFAFGDSVTGSLHR